MMYSIKKWIAAFIKHRIIVKRKRLENPKYKKFEFSKKIAVFSCILMIMSIILSVILSAGNKDPISEITATVISVCGGYLCTYGIKSAFEKNSRNKYGIDEFGNPVAKIDEESEEDVYG